MTIRIHWAPPNVPVVYYEVHSAPTVTGVFALAAVVNDVRPGPSWDPVKARFFYDDAQGDDHTVYRVLAYDQTGLVDDTGIFQPSASFAAALATKQVVNHDFGGVNNLQVTGPNGVGIAGAVIRIYLKPDYDAGRLDVPLFAVECDGEGKWKTPVYLDVGMTYTLLTEKKGSFQSKAVEINV